MLYHSFEKFGNPFDHRTAELVQIVSKQVMSDEAMCSVVNGYDLGRKQIGSMFKERVCGNKLSLYSTIHKNKLHLFRKKTQVDLGKSEITA